jgi:hypothetical protein
MAEDVKGIFISYRRDESAAYAGRMADGFTEHFGENRVFRDIDSIEPGLDFAEAIERAVDSSEVLIAVIGRNWLTATDAAGHKRLENPDDYVRMEIGAALQRNIRVIPVLVQGAAMPSAEQLPEDLASLTHRNAFELHDSSWNEELRRLITTLDKVLEPRPLKSRIVRNWADSGPISRILVILGLIVYVGGAIIFIAFLISGILQIG